MLRQNLSQKQMQKLSPQQIQLMKLLQVPTIMLEQRIQEELESNPALEDSKDELNTEEEENENETDDVSIDEKTRDDDINEEAERQEDNSLEDYLEDYMNDDEPSYKYEVNNYSIDDDDKSIPVAIESSFHEEMERQLGLLSLEGVEEKIALQIIGSIDGDGYLRREPMAITDDLAFAHNIIITKKEVLHVLKKIQTFEPAGIGAQSLQECLMLQLDRKIHSLEISKKNEEETKHLRLAHTIIKKYFKEFSKKHYNKLLRKLSLYREDLRLATEEILKLNPKPGSVHASSAGMKKQYIIPDFIIESKSGELDLSLNNRNAPELRVNNQYKEMLQAYKLNKKNKSQREAAMFVKQKIDAARWFIDAIKQRQNTMLKTMYAIMQYQYAFFFSGDEKKLRPMILKDIAEITGLDISTISRVANSKYVQTEFGTILLKQLFSESLQTTEGEEVSTREVKKIMSELVSSEPKRKPYSDEVLKKLLLSKGYNIARRTVAKYRDQLGIPVARLRKEI
ncbi:MAG: RNA polymerase factor sigma-54 [Saprospiraceae bacterium]|nr:RNA polymerase factor sigma-54 [Saprospiraceae bacterium]